MSLEDGKELMRKCFHELKVRYLINIPKFIVKVADANGIHTIDLGTDGSSEEQPAAAAAAAALAAPSE
jgi:hypothetical protein